MPLGTVLSSCGYKSLLLFKAKTGKGENTMKTKEELNALKKKV